MKFCLKIIFVLVTVTTVQHAFAQEKGKALFKIEVKDGKVTKVATLDSTLNKNDAVPAPREIDGKNRNLSTQSKESNHILNDDKVIRKNLFKSSEYLPSKAVRTPMHEDPEYKPGAGRKGTRPEITTTSSIPKGSTLGVSTTPTSLQFDGSKFTTRLAFEESPKNNSAVPDVQPASGEVIMTENFESVFPSTGWTAYAESGYADAYWNDVSYRAYNGGWSGFCAGQGTQSVSSGTPYPHLMNTWMIYGPFDLTGATDATLSFYDWMNTESGYDYLHYAVSTNGIDFNGYATSGSTAGAWEQRVVSLADFNGVNVIGHSQVWIAFVFQSDESISYEGAYVDDIVLEKSTSTTPAPNLYWSFMELTTASWIEGNSVTADLTVVNNGGATAAAHYSKLYLSTDTYISSGDYQLGGDVYYAAIAAGSEQTQSLTFTVPQGDGTYYLGAIIDYYDVVAESDETDNNYYRTGQVAITPVTAADLAWSNLYLTAETWTAGDVITATLEVQNYGDGSADAHYSRIYLSVNNTITSEDLQLGDDLIYSTIAASGSQQQDVTFLAPALDGTYYVGAIVDYYNNVSETDEENNGGARGGLVEILPGELYADLHWTSLSLTTSVWVPGNEVSAGLTVENIGSALAASHYARIYLSADDFVDESDIQLGNDVQFGLINAGEFLTVDHGFSIPVVTNGSYYVGALIDIYDEVNESDEGNNGGVRTGMVDVVSEIQDVDLEWTSLSLNTSAWIEGIPVTATLTEINNGTFTASSHATKLFISENDIISNTDTQLGSDLSFPSIVGGAEEAVSIEFVAPAGNGTYYVGAIVDYYNGVIESDETNNGGTRSGTVTISPSSTESPELAAISIGLTSEQWVIGNTITADVTEENTGNATAGAHSSRLLLSDNTTISSSDLQLGSDVSFDAIAAASSGVASITFTVPDVAEGTYYVGIITDVLEEITELDESNNIRYRTGTVTIESGSVIPDIHVTPLTMTITEPSTQTGSVISGRQGTSSPSNNIKPTKSEYSPKQLIVKFKSGATADVTSRQASSNELRTFNEKYKIKVLKSLPKSNRSLAANGRTMLIQYESDEDVYEVISNYHKLGIIEYAEPNYRVTHNETTRTLATSGDPFYGNQWGLKNTGNAISYNGNSVGSPGEDLNVEPAWDITQGSSAIIVAVIDDGVDLTHSEFSGRLVQGYDFVNEDNDPTPVNDDGHGNACAGIIGAANNGAGVVGVAPNVRIMPIKSMENNSGWNDDIIEGIYFAVDNGARVISMSLGGGSHSLAFEEAIAYAVNNGVVVLAAAGNDDTDNTVTPHYPASYPICISVGAMSPCGLRKNTVSCDEEFWWGSNYGDLDFIAPGTRIYTTDLSGPSGYSGDDYTPSFNGTSSATPFAAGVAALLLSADPSLTPAEVRQIMQESSVDVGSAGYDSETGHGRLDAFAALQLITNGGGDNLITITNTGSGTLTVDEISVNEEWLTLSGAETPMLLNSGESKVLSVSVDWSLVSGSESATISIASNDPDESLVDVVINANSTEVETFTIAATSNPSNGGLIEGTGAYSAGQSVTLVATPLSRFVFVNWTENDAEVSSDASYTFNVTSDRTLVANFAPETYTISAVPDPVEGGNIAGTGNYQYGETITLDAVPSTGFQFVNWTEDGEVVSNAASYFFTVTEDRSLTASFAVDPFTISASVEPVASGTVSGAGNYLPGQSATLQAIANEGYRFVNWVENGVVVSTDPVFIFAVTGNRNLTCNFEINSFTVAITKKPPFGGSVTGTGEYLYNTTVTLTATPASGYEFINWTENGALISTDQNYVFTITQNRNLFANFRIESLEITATADPAAGGAILGTGLYQNGQNVTLTASPATGYRFINWTENGSVIATTQVLNFIATGDRALVAHFEILYYEIGTSVSPANSGTTDGAGEYAHGSGVTLTATPASTYEFVNWTEDGTEVSTSTTYTFTATKHRNVVANFAPISYDIITIASPTEGGTVSGGGSFEENENVTVTATPATGYAFINWTENGTVVSTSATYQFSANADRTLTANFGLGNINISVAASPAEGGTVGGEGDYQIGENVSVTATPSLGYNFLNWKENESVVSTTASYTFTATASRVLTATFQKKTFDISLSALPSEGGSVSGAGLYEYGQSASVTATASPGYTFANWTENGNAVSTNPVYTFNVTEPRTLVANFQVQTYNITASVSPASSGTVTGAGTYNAGQTATLVATPANGFVFINWTENGVNVSTNSSFQFTVNTHRVLVANFGGQTFTISVNREPLTGGSVTGAGTYNVGETVTLNAFAEADYSFEGWIENAIEISDEPQLTFTANADRTITAKFILTPVLSANDKTKREVKVFPNPMMETLKIEWADYRLSVISDLSGKELIITNEKEIAVGELKSGMYFITVKGKDNMLYRFKVMKE